MSARTRVFAVVAALAAGAGVATVGGTVLISRDQAVPAPRATGLRPGRPPLLLDLGVRADPESVAIRRAAALYERGRPAQARRAFARYGSVPAQVGQAIAAWPAGTIVALERLAGSHPRDGFVRLELGVALLWARRDRDAVAAWRATGRVAPDTPAALAAENLLHPNFPQGRPVFVPSFGVPPTIARLAPARQLRALAAAARHGGARPKLLYGVALQRLGRPVSAEREYRAAARLSPGDPEARVAAAVGLFDKAEPSRAFSRLGPLVRPFPHSVSVRFHLGLLLLWLGRVDDARVQLKRARAAAPSSPLGREANAFLARLGTIGTS